MTFIAAFADGDVADVITDTWTYPHDYSTIRQTSKVLTLPHIDTVVATIGNHGFGATWDLAVADLALTLDFDGLVGAAPERLRTLSEQAQADATPGQHYGGETVVHTGWSRRSGCFEVVSFDHRGGFEPRRPVGAAFIHPSPLPFRPSAGELAGMRASIDNDRLIYRSEAERVYAHEVYEENYRIFSSRPPIPLEVVPASNDDWARFASRVRSERATLPGHSKMKILLGGSLYRTTLGRGMVVQQRIHDFDDSGEEFAQIIAGSRHPAAATLPCLCESGQPFEKCCMDATWKDVPRVPIG